MAAAGPAPPQGAPADSTGGGAARAAVRMCRATTMIHPGNRVNHPG